MQVLFLQICKYVKTKNFRLITGNSGKNMAAELGFVPRHTESESAVLPLHNSAILLKSRFISATIYIIHALKKKSIVF